MFKTFHIVFFFFFLKLSLLQMCEIFFALLISQYHYLYCHNVVNEVSVKHGILAVCMFPLRSWCVVQQPAYFPLTETPEVIASERERECVKAKELNIKCVRLQEKEWKYNTLSVSQLSYFYRLLL